MEKRITRTVLLLILLCLAALAQNEPSGTGSISPGSLLELDSEKHILRTGDKIEFHISALPEMKQAYTVRVDGRFFHPLVGDVQASGRVLEDLRVELKERLAKELRHPNFRLGILSVAQHQVAVLGEAKQQGTFQVGIGATVLDLIAAAGGLGEKADRDKAILLRGDEQLPVSLRPEEGQGLTKVRSGDVLYILAGSPVSVTGEVTQPGVYSLSRVSGTPRAAILAAGGAKEEASLARVRLIRATVPKPMILDLRADAEVPLPKPAEQLLEGDILVVPARKVVVLGAVSKPGAVPLRGDETLIDIIPSMVNEGSDIDKIMVVRAKDVMANRDEKEVYNLREYFEDGKADVVVPIRDGDLVYVPAKRERKSILGELNLLNILSIAQFLL